MYAAAGHTPCKPPYSVCATADHLVRRVWVWVWYRYAHRPEECASCSSVLHRPLGPSCMRRMLRDNMVSAHVPCACLANELRQETAVELLVVDAEGYDDVALRQYPLRSLPTSRLVFEARHLSIAHSCTVHYTHVVHLPSVHCLTYC